MRKITNISLIFTAIGMIACSSVSYASNLRVPLIDYERIKKSAEQARQIELIKEFRGATIIKAEMLVEGLTDGMFKLAPYNKDKLSGEKWTVCEVEEIITGKMWFLRLYFSSTIEAVDLARRIAERMADSGILKRHLPEIRFGPSDTDFYYLTSKEGDVRMDVALREKMLSSGQILAIGNQIIDLFEELERHPAIYFSDNCDMEQYMIDFKTDSSRPRLIFVDIGIEGLKTKVDEEGNYRRLLLRLHDSLPESCREINTKNPFAIVKVVGFFRKHDTRLKTTNLNNASYNRTLTSGL